MLRVSEFGQFCSQDFYLFVHENSNSSNVSAFMKRVDLILAQTKTTRILVQLRLEHRPDGIMKSRKVLHRVECIIRLTAASTPERETHRLPGADRQLANERNRLVTAVVD